MFEATAARPLHAIGCNLFNVTFLRVQTHHTTARAHTNAHARTHTQIVISKKKKETQPGSDLYNIMSGATAGEKIDKHHLKIYR